MSDTVTIHATCVNLKSRTVLLVGDSGAGKSDLALRLIDLGGQLVADDQVVVSQMDGLVMASAPPQLAQMLEVRGVGIFKFPNFLTRSAISFVVQLVPPELEDRLPERQTYELLGVALPLWKLYAFYPSAAHKIKLIAETLGGNRMLDAERGLLQ